MTDDNPPATTAANVLDALANAPITGIGLHPEGSNYVFLARIEPENGAAPLLAIYKPRDGERPLRDFPSGTLYRRECAAYELSARLGWPPIPPTVIRDGPHGPGSVQLFVDADPAANYFTMRDENLSLFEPVAAFDLLVNNADRKGGACLRDRAGRLWVIDHGLSFNPDARLRTVMWEFCNQPISGPLLEDLRRVAPELSAARPLGRRLRELLSEAELDALRERLRKILANPVFPALDPHRNIPWPWL